MVTQWGPGSRSSHSSESSLHEIYVDQAPPEPWDGRETDSSLEVSSVIKSDTGRLLGKCFTPWQLVRPVHEHRGFSLGISRAGLWGTGWGPLLFCTSVSKCSLVSLGNSSWHGEVGMCFLIPSIVIYLYLPPISYLYNECHQFTSYQWSRSTLLFGFEFKKKEKEL